MQKKEDVITEPSPVEEVEQIVEQQEQQPEQVEQEAGTSSPEVKPEPVHPDRPEINYAMEAARKATEALEIARQLREQQTTQQTQAPQYSRAQLRAFAESTQDQNQKLWALEELDKVEKQERQKEMRELFEAHTQRTQGEVKRHQSTQFVAQNFPDCFVKDEAGNVLGWNNTSPLTQKIGQYMQDPRFANDPEGIVAAAKMAAFDLGISVKLQKKVSQTQAQLARAQKRTLIAGGGISVQQDGSAKQKQIVSLVDKYQKTGDKDAFKELAKLRGLIPAER